MDRIFTIDSNPLVFFFPDAHLKAEMQEKILKAGGKVSNSIQDNTIIIISSDLTRFPIHNLLDKKAYHVDFITNSILESKLQSIDDYLLVLIRIPTCKTPRAMFSDQEEMKIALYVNQNSGNPANLKYWKIALKSGVDFGRHSIESLRGHWRYKYERVHSIRSNHKKHKKTIKREVAKPTVFKNISVAKIEDKNFSGFDCKLQNSKVKRDTLPIEIYKDLEIPLKTNNEIKLSVSGHKIQELPIKRKEKAEKIVSDDIIKQNPVKKKKNTSFSMKYE
jgi:BRCT domain, a BRCA1 C-terminus domain